MLIDAAAEPGASLELRWLSAGRYTIGWKGHVYFAGSPSGAPTISRLIDELGRRDLPTVCADLYGVYGLFIYDSVDRQWLIVGDNAGLYRIFYDDSRIATSFLELARATGRTAAMVEREAILEFILHGGNFGKRTPLPGIYKLARGDYLRLAVDGPGKPEIVTRPEPSMSTSGDAFVLDCYAAAARSLADRQVSVDLTGGFDSRVTACLLDQAKLPFECALSGMPGTSEVKAAGRAADVLGHELHLHQQNIDNLEQDLPAVFRAGDGLTELSRLHRNRQLCLLRLARGIEVMVHSGGGGYFRDHTFVQDFPRYGSRAINIERYYRLRTIPVTIPAEQLTADAQKMLEKIQSSTLQLFEKSKDTNNNRTYDRIYFEIRAPEFYGATCTNYINMGMDIVVPYLDRRMFQVAMTTPPWQRAFQYWHRRMITAHCPRMAALPTTEGYTASSRTTAIALEFGNYLRVQAGRVARKLGERYFGKSSFHRVGELEAEPPTYRAALRSAPQFGAAVDRLKACSILAADLDPDRVRNVHVGRILTMGMLLAYLDGEDIDDRSAAH